MWIWIVLAVIVLAGVVYAFWPRVGGLDGRVRRAGAVGGSKAQNYTGPSDVGGGGAGGGL